MKLRKKNWLKSSVVFLVAFGTFAEESPLDDFSSSLDFAQVVSVKAVERKNASWCFHTRVRHNDQGWDHYANGWEVTDFDGNQLGERPLAHPHDNEQPFTRSQCGIDIPKGIMQVVVRAKCNQHGFGGKSVVVSLNKSKGDDYTVKRR